MIWYLAARNQFFLLPPNMRFPPGNSLIRNLEGINEEVDLGFLQPFTCTEQEAYQYLRDSWKDIVEEGKKAWLQMRQFAEITKRDDMTVDFQSGFMEALSKAGIQWDQEGFSIPENLEDLFPEEEQKEMANQAAIMIKDILGDLAGDIPDDPEDMEAWAKNLHDKFFAEEIAEEERKTSEEIRKSVQESIAKRLREQGLDFIGDD